MATYAIGDIQGCRESLERLLETLRFDPAVDRVWFVGDLVNRGPDSLGTLRLVRNQLGAAATTVLGNHDFHLLAVYAGQGRLKPDDTLQAVLDAEDGPELIDWLRQRPLMHVDPTLGWAMTHAGIPPVWSFDEARVRAEELHGALCRADDEATFAELLGDLFGNDPADWSPHLRGVDRLRYITNALTRMRFVDETGRLLLRYKGPPDEAPEGHHPWFEVRRNLRSDPDPLRLVTGHWSTLGYHDADGIRTIDTGCLWGGTLTAIVLDDPDAPPISLACPAPDSPPKD